MDAEDDQVTTEHGESMGPPNPDHIDRRSRDPGRRLEDSRNATLSEVVGNNRWLLRSLVGLLVSLVMLLVGAVYAQITTAALARDGIVETLRQANGVTMAEVATLKARLDSYDGRLGRVESKIDSLDAKIDTLLVRSTFVRP